MQAPETTSADERRALESSPSSEHELTTAPVRDDAWREGLKRVAYWTPVWVPMILFAHLAWLGLRPALSEAERLDDYAAVLDMREDKARSESILVKAHLDARLDPVYRKRQERLRAQYHPRDVTRIADGDADVAAAR
jgi:hypothetical protein